MLNVLISYTDDRIVSPSMEVTPKSGEGAEAHGPDRLTIAVAGATGVVGRHVVADITRRGHRVQPIARAHGIDLLDRGQVVNALRGVDVVVDVANVDTTKADAATAFFTGATSNLLEGCREHGVSRYVVLSIVGVDRVRFGYYTGTLRQEALVRQSHGEHVVLRATQFHEFAGQTWSRMSWGPVAVAPQMRCAPVAAREVAERLGELAVAGAPKELLEMRGPEVRWLPELMRAWGRARGSRKLVLSTPIPGEGGRAMRTGALLPAAPDFIGEESYDQWLQRSRP